MSASHKPPGHALLVLDVFETVLDFIVQAGGPPPHYYNPGIHVQTPDPRSQYALAALASTCRGFTEPCLDRLWQKLRSLDPLFKCSQMDSLPTSGKCPLPLSEQSIFYYYSTRIRELEIHCLDTKLLKDTNLPETNFFPNLKVLKCAVFSQIGAILPLLNPGLVTLDIRTIDSDASLVSLLKTLPSRCPSLTTVSFRIQPVSNTEEIRDVISQCVYSLKDVKRLTLEAIVDGAVVQHLLLSSKLDELNLHPPLWPSRLLNWSPPGVPFRNVKKLDFSVDNLSQMVSLLRPGNQTFHHLVLHLGAPEPAASTKLLFTELASHSQKTLLQTLRLNHTHRHYIPANEITSRFALTPDTFRPLVSLSHLQKLNIWMQNLILLADEELADLASNWPLLEAIELCGKDWSPVAPRLTLKSLMMLAHICPRLWHVSLTLDARQVITGFEAGLKFKTITKLQFPWSPIDSPVPVSKFLVTHFPSVRSIRAKEMLQHDLGPLMLVNIDGDLNEKWLAVERSLVRPLGHFYKDVWGVHYLLATSDV